MVEILRILVAKRKVRTMAAVVVEIQLIQQYIELKIEKI
jgi:hypothetical protein